jgi:hypothetical protein
MIASIIFLLALVVLPFLVGSTLFSVLKVLDNPKRFISISVVIKLVLYWIIGAGTITFTIG